MSASDLSHRYLWGPAVDQLLADEHVESLGTAGDVVWPLTDNLGTVRDLATYDSNTDVTTIANHRVYDAYGNRTSQTNSAVDCLFGYTARQYDEVSNLQNNLNRWYDAKVGRWVSEDPIGFWGGDANTSRYVGNSPTKYIDPNGLCPSGGSGGTNGLYEVCFAEGTPVLMADGVWKKIEEVQPGETVMSASENDPEGKVSGKAVVQVYHNKPQPLIELHLDDGMIRPTANHPFYVRGKGWIVASQLEPGDWFRGHDDQWVELRQVIVTDIIEPVFNLQVVDYHTYFVGTPNKQIAILVHNDSTDNNEPSLFDPNVPIQIPLTESPDDRGKPYEESNRMADETLKEQEDQLNPVPRANDLAQIAAVKQMAYDETAKIHTTVGEFGGNFGPTGILVAGAFNMYDSMTNPHAAPDQILTDIKSTAEDIITDALQDWLLKHGKGSK